jgi:hypothetical protein
MAAANQNNLFPSYFGPSSKPIQSFGPAPRSASPIPSFLLFLDRNNVVTKYDAPLPPISRLGVIKKISCDQKNLLILGNHLLKRCVFF